MDFFSRRVTWVVLGGRTLKTFPSPSPGNAIPGRTALALGSLDHVLERKVPNHERLRVELVQVQLVHEHHRHTSVGRVQIVGEHYCGPCAELDRFPEVRLVGVAVEHPLDQTREPHRVDPDSWLVAHASQHPTKRGFTPPLGHASPAPTAATPDTSRRVVGVFRQFATGNWSGAPVELEYALVYDLRDAQLVRIRAFLDRSEALEASGPTP